jgi:hypothetical protein
MQQMTLPLVVALSQLADGLAFQLAQGHGRELNPGAASIFDAFGPTTVLAFKIVAAVVLGIGSYALLRHHRARAAVEWLAVIGFVGCLTELIAVL